MSSILSHVKLLKVNVKAVNCGKLFLFILVIFTVTQYVNFHSILKDIHVKRINNINGDSENAYRQRNLLSLSYMKYYKTRSNCSSPAIKKFPSDGLTRQQRQHGWIVLHVILILYCFWTLATICDDYLLPSIHIICEAFNIDNDVIGATIMAAAVSTPELFMNCIGTFVTKDGIGVSSIVGSAVFNVLATPACCGLFIASSLKLNWWPITRDCLFYSVAVLSLLGIVSDGKIMWYEAFGLVLGYFLYIFVMYNHKKVVYKARHFFIVNGWKQTHYQQVTEFTPLILHSELKNAPQYDSQYSLAKEAYITLNIDQSDDKILAKEDSKSPWLRDERYWFEFILKWPIIFILWLTIPNSYQYSRLKYLTIICSTIWIAVLSYVMAFLITIIGDTLNIPDTVMGLTFLAIGMTVPEAMSSILVTRQGHAIMGLSNSLGSNTFGILLSLGLPWLIKTVFLPETKAQHSLNLHTDSLMYTSFILLLTIISFYLILLYTCFHLNKKFGVLCLIMYAILIGCAILLELNVFFPINWPACSH